MSSINRPLIEQIAREFKDRFGTSPLHTACAPGRVNLLGEHVDYNDGFVLPAAIEKAAYATFSPSSDGISRLLALDFAEEIQISAEAFRTKIQRDSSRLPQWGLYPAGVMKTLADHDFSPFPIDAVFSSDIPPGAGLSSSASIEMVFLTAWQMLGGWSMPPMERAQLCQEAENRYVGVGCGIMDQFASACGVEGKILFLDCRSLDWDTIAMPAGTTMVIADTMSRRKLTRQGYNQRRIDCDTAVMLLKKQVPGIQSLRDVKPEEYYRLAHYLPVRIEKRVRHVVEEIERTRLAKKYLEQGDSASFGRLMNESHASLRDLYEVSSRELDTMVTIAQSIDGCYGARLTGAGFGGCAVCLVESDKSDRLLTTLKHEFHGICGVKSESFVTMPANGARML